MKSEPRSRWIEIGSGILAALVATGVLFLVRDPFHHPLVDDAAIILRYLDHFRLGYFYSYEITDGPVFGISGFVHGLFTGLLAWLQVRPEICLLTSDLLGSFLFFYFFFRVQNRVLGSKAKAALCIAGLVAGSQYIAFTFSIGLETPLHLGLIAWMVWLYVDRSRWLPVAAALAIVSKLDALPVAACFMAASVLREVVERAPGVSAWVALRTCTRKLGVFAAVLATWLAAVTLIFGSPIPQTLVAKWTYQFKGTGSWFPFADNLVMGRQRLITAGVVGTTIAIATALDIRRRNLSLGLVLTASAFLSLAQYWFYNPGEQMPWYYTLPETLFLWAFLLSPLAFTGRARWVVASTVGLTLLARLTLPLRFVAGFNQYLDISEPERMQVGAFADSVTPDGGTVITGHGYVARAIHGRVVDYSGLNSRLATKYGVSPIRLIDPAHADTLVTTGFLAPEIQLLHHLRLAGSFYSIRTQGAAAWRVSTVSPDDCQWTRWLTVAEIHGGTVEEGPTILATGKALTFDLDHDGGVESLQWGVLETGTDQTLEMLTRSDAGERRESCRIPREPRPTCRGACSSECRFEVGPGDEPKALEISSTTTLRLVEPTETIRSHGCP